MAAVVADTHAVLWMLTNSAKLSQAARTALEQAVMAGEPIYVASISVVEVVYLVDKNRLPKSALERLIDALRNPTSGLAIVALNQDIAEAMTQIPIKIVPDMPVREASRRESHYCGYCFVYEIAFSDSRSQNSSGAFNNNLVVGEG